MTNVARVPFTLDPPNIGCCGGDNDYDSPFMCGIGGDDAADGDDHHYKKEEDDATKGAHASAIHPRSSDWKQDKPPAGQTFTPAADTP